MKKLAFIFVFLFFISASSYSQLWKQYADSAKFYSDQQDFDDAINYYNKATLLFPTDSIYTDTYIQFSKRKIILYYLTRQYAETIKECNALQKIIEKVHTEMNADYAWNCNILGVIYNTNGSLDSAMIFYVKAKEIREKLFGNKDPAYAQSCNNLGALYHDLGQYDKAEPLLLEAKDIREKLTPLKQNDPYAITCVSVANLYRDMGQYEKAESFYLLAKERRSIAGKENQDYALSCNILADLYSYMHRFEKAEALYLEAKDIRQRLDSGSYQYAQTCNNLSSLYRDMGQYNKAEALAWEAKKIYDSLPPEHPAHAINFNNLGQLYYAMGNYSKAATWFLKARRLWENALGKEHPYFIDNSEELARVYWHNNETKKADQLYKEAAESKYNRLTKIFQFTNEGEKEMYLKNINGSTDEYQSFYYQKIAHDKAGESFAISLLNRNLILSSGQQIRQRIYKSKDDALIKLYKHWTVLKEQLANLYAKGADANTDQVKTIEDKADVIEKELSRKSSAFKKSQNKITWQQIQQSLGANEAAIEFVEFQDDNGKPATDSTRYIALILRKDGRQPQMVPLFEKNQLDHLLTPLKNAENINDLYSPGSDNLQATMYDLVWRPVEKYLHGVTKIYFAPAGDLFKISFAAIAKNNHKVLSDEYQLQQLNTTASLVSKRPEFIATSDKIQLYGGIQYDVDSTAMKQVTSRYHANNLTTRSLPDEVTRGGSFQYLPGTKDEVNAVELLAHKFNHSANVVTGINASEESFKLLQGDVSPAVLHIATHGFFFPDPQYDTRDNFQRKFETSGKVFRQSNNPLLRSGLLFAGANNAWRGKYFSGIDDGILTAYEVSNMYLPDTKLVVLSACETALGDIEGSEGVYGLQRGFKMAGAKNLIMSLWKVPDKETSGFMQIFYRNMFNGQSITDAFYHAQNTMKNKYRNEPYKWAAWILVK